MTFYEQAAFDDCFERQYLVFFISPLSNWGDVVEAHVLEHGIDHVFYIEQAKFMLHRGHYMF